MEDKLLKEILEYNLLNISSKYDKQGNIKSIINNFNRISKNQTAILEEKILTIKLVARRSN